MYDGYSRMELLLGQNGVDRLSSARIAVFGLGGAGSYAVEALARCGVGSLTLVDHEAVSPTDLNRQLLALHSTIGRKKVQLAKERIHDIDENILVHIYETFYSLETAQMFDLHCFDYIIDAMDTADSKILLIEQAKRCSVPVISCMDTANKRNPFRLEIGDISKVTGDGLAREIRDALRKKGVRRVKVLYSGERVRKPDRVLQGGVDERAIRGSISFIPGAAGFMLAGEVVRDLLADQNSKTSKIKKTDNKIGKGKNP